MEGEEVYLLLILNLGILNITPHPHFTPGEEPLVPIG
jgi:hypothetical protein